MRLEEKINKFLFHDVDNSPLIVFRILFGLLIFLECAGAIFTGWVKETLVEPKYHFTFIGFEWLQPLPGYGMYFYYGLMAALGLLILLGCFYKIATFSFSFLWWGCYLMQKSHYNNHYYLLILLSFCMAIMPAHRYFSIDVKRNPSLKNFTCPKWCYELFIIQLWIVFIFASIAKIYPDWLNAKPIKIWFSAKGDYPLIGGLLISSWLPYFIAYSGVIFDLLIVPLLIWNRTRFIAFILLIIFNVFNSIVFQIGIFPYLMIAMAVFFFPPETIRKIFFRKRLSIGNDLSVLLNSSYSGYNRKIILISFTFFFVLQIYLPVRHYFYEDDVHWNEEGHRMAWQMMLRTKEADITFKVKDPSTSQTWEVYPTQYFSYEQSREIGKLPDMTWQAAQHLKKIYQEKGYDNVEVYANSTLSLNGGPWKTFIDPNVNLAGVPWQRFKHSEWILPYNEK